MAPRAVWMRFLISSSVLYSVCAPFNASESSLSCIALSMSTWLRPAALAIVGPSPQPDQGMRFPLSNPEPDLFVMLVVPVRVVVHLRVPPYCPDSVAVAV